MFKFICTGIPWRRTAKATLRIALNGTGTVLICTGRVLYTCGRQLTACAANIKAGSSEIDPGAAPQAAG